MNPGADQPAPWLPHVDIDLRGVSANFETLARCAPSAAAAAVVKSDAYGLGAAEIARTLIARNRCRTFYVTYPDEGAMLRRAIGGHVEDVAIVVFNGPTPQTVEHFKTNRLTPVLNSLGQCRLWADTAPTHECALHFDTGMHRLGIPADEADDARAVAAGLNVRTVLSHLAMAASPHDAANLRQLSEFLGLCAFFPGARRSLSSSGGALIDPSFGLDEVRLGIALYGVSPTDEPDGRILPVARLSAPVIQVQSLPAGSAVGYGGDFVAKRDSRLATLSIGYADGLRRSASNRAHAFIAGHLCPIVGRISMDLVCLDVTDARAPVNPGDRAELFGTHLPIETAARAWGSIGYEVLTGLGPRVVRLYRHGEH